MQEASVKKLKLDKCVLSSRLWLIAELQSFEWAEVSHCFWFFFFLERPVKVHYSNWVGLKWRHELNFRCLLYVWVVILLLCYGGKWRFSSTLLLLDMKLSAESKIKPRFVTSHLIQGVNILISVLSSFTFKNFFFLLIHLFFARRCLVMEFLAAAASFGPAEIYSYVSSA